MDKHTTHSPDSGVHEIPPGADGLTEQDLTDLHEDILDENEDNVRQLLKEITEDGLSVEDLCHTELQVEPLSEDHPLNREALSALHRAALLDSNSILTLLLTSSTKINPNLPLKESGYTPLHVASLAGIPAVASYLAFNGAKVNTKDHKGQTPIHLCAKNGHADIAKVLVVKGGSIDDRDKKKRTPLHFACKEGQVKFLHFLLKKNIQLDVVDENGWTPLHFACSRGHQEITELLLSNCPKLINMQDSQGNTAFHVLLANAAKRKDNVLCGDFDACVSVILSSPGVDLHLCNLRKESLLHFAVEHQQISAIKELLQRKADVNGTDINWETPIFRAKSVQALDELLSRDDVAIDVQNYVGDTVLHKCAREKSMDSAMLSKLLENNAQIDVCNHQSETALHIACQHGQSDKASLLFDNGAQCDVTDCAGQTILHAAIENGHAKLARSLIERQCVNVDAQNKKGQTCLHVAILYRMDASLVKLIIDHCQNLNQPDEFGLLPADYAVQKSDENITRVLIQKGGELMRTSNPFLFVFANDNDMDIVKHLQTLGLNPGLCDGQGRSMLHVAVLNKSWDLARHLIGSNARCDLVDNDGNTPLHLACLYCPHADLIEDLVCNSTSINKVNSDGRTPLHEAASNETVAVTEKLLSLGARIDQQDQQNRTSLHICGESLVAGSSVAEQKLEILLDHIDSGDPEIHKTSHSGKQILHYVCEAGNTKLTHLCLQKGSKCDKADERGMTALHYACTSGNLEVVSKLLTHKARIEALDFQGQTPLYQAVMADADEVVELLLNHGANIDHQRLSDQATVLHASLTDKNQRISEVLFMHEPNINLQNSDGQTAFHLTSRYGTRDLLKSCLSLTPDHTIKDHCGQKAIHNAVYNQDTSVMSLLLTSKCAVDSVDQDNNTALLLSSKKGSYDHMSILLESQADVNHQNKDMMSPIHFSLKHEETDLLELLIANEADLNILDDSGRTPIVCAIESQNLEGALLLLEQDVDLKTADKSGSNVLHKIMVLPSLPLHFLRTLSRNGCDFHLKNKDGVTPLDLMQRREDDNINEVMQTLGIDFHQDSGTGSYEE